MGTLARAARKLYRGAKKLVTSCVPGSHLTVRHPPYAEVLRELAGIGGDDPVAERILVGLERQGRLLNRRDAMAHLVDEHPAPHWANLLLAKEEARSGTLRVHSLPTNVWMDLSSVCNVECRFCKYTAKLLPTRFVTLDEVKAIRWLPYVRLLNLSAGTGETIVNPQFVEILDYLRDTYPHLHLSFLSNGKALSPTILRACAGRLDALHVSMNAANREDYERIIRHGNWEQFDRNMSSMPGILDGCKRPLLSASFVMTRANIGGAVECLEYAARCGARLVLFHHYYVPYIQDIHRDRPEVKNQKIPATQSLYYDRELSDEVFARVKERGEQLGVDVKAPVPFSREDCRVAYGVRTETAAEADCYAPWMNLYLLWGIKSKREEATICCGMASDIGAYFDRDAIATTEGLREFWNCPIVQAYRETVNAPGVNPICELCRITDRFDPAAPYPDQREFFAYAKLPVPEHLRPEGDE